MKKIIKEMKKNSKGIKAFLEIFKEIYYFVNKQLKKDRNRDIHRGEIMENVRKIIKSIPQERKNNKICVKTNTEEENKEVENQKRKMELNIVNMKNTNLDQRKLMKRKIKRKLNKMEENGILMVLGKEEIFWSVKEEEEEK